MRTVLSLEVSYFANLYPKQAKRHAKGAPEKTKSVFETKPSKNEIVIKTMSNSEGFDEPKDSLTRSSRIFVS